MILLKIKSVGTIVVAASCLMGCQNQYAEQQPSLFPRGEAIANSNFVGTAYLYSLTEADSINPTTVGVVTFSPWARTNWHLHPGGQILIVASGKGYYQEKGKPKQILQKGDVVKCPPHWPHWHGASPKDTLVHIAITNRHHGETVWMQPVSNLEYHQ